MAQRVLRGDQAGVWERGAAAGQVPGTPGPSGVMGPPSLPLSLLPSSSEPVGGLSQETWPGASESRSRRSRDCLCLPAMSQGEILQPFPVPGSLWCFVPPDSYRFPNTPLGSP